MKQRANDMTLNGERSKIHVSCIKRFVVIAGLMKGWVSVIQIAQTWQPQLYTCLFFKISVRGSLHRDSSGGATLAWLLRKKSCSNWNKIEEIVEEKLWKRKSCLYDIFMSRVAIILYIMVYVCKVCHLRWVNEGVNNATVTGPWHTPPWHGNSYIRLSLWRISI